MALESMASSTVGARQWLGLSSDRRAHGGDGEVFSAAVRASIVPRHALLYSHVRKKAANSTGPSPHSEVAGIDGNIDAKTMTWEHGGSGEAMAFHGSLSISSSPS
jgi:hypothetical protein